MFTMYGLLSTISLMFFTNCRATEHILRLNDPPSNAVLVSVAVNASVVLRCETTSKLPKVQWLHNGNDLNENVLRYDERTSSITISRYSTKFHDGVYECYANNASSSIRLRGEDDVILPAGFRFCHKSENAACDHARACMVDGLEKISCVCYPGWSGESCHLPRDIQKANLINGPSCPYWPPVVTLMVFVLCVFIMLVCIYNFRIMHPKKLSRCQNSRLMKVHMRRIDRAACSADANHAARSVRRDRATVCLQRKLQTYTTVLTDIQTKKEDV